MIVSLDDIKAHLRIVGNDDDPLLALYYQAAEEHIRTLTELELSGDAVPFAIRAVCLLLISDLYENRTAQGVDALHEHPAVMRLLSPYRTW
jgi:uncharacterized phage protein (predicted DNA packaging)